MDILWLLLSFVLLIVGAELSLDGAEKVGKKFGLSPMAIGVFLLAFGTSLPELAVSHIAMGKQASQVALGNIVGSNLCNSFFILGLLALIKPLPEFTVKNLSQYLWHLALSVILGGVVFFSSGLSWGVGVLLLSFFLLYTFKTLKNYCREEFCADSCGKLSHLSFSLSKALLGFIFLLWGGNLLIETIQDLSVKLEIPQYVMSVLIVALGTSLPELVTSLYALWKKKNTQLIVGNIIGSNIFNVAMILGSISFYEKTPWPALQLEIILLILLALFFVLLVFFKRVLSRTQGIFMVLIYLGFCWFSLKA